MGCSCGRHHVVMRRLRRQDNSLINKTTTNKKSLSCLGHGRLFFILVVGAGYYL